LDNEDLKTIEHELQHPTDQRLFVIYDAIRKGMSVERIHELTHIDAWFLYKIKRIYDVEQKLHKFSNGMLPSHILLEAKRHGFADRQIATILKCSEGDVRSMRDSHNIHPLVKQIDTLGAEFPAKTNYLYLTYHGSEDDIALEQRQTVIILGSGAYRIGSSVEFDWCCVNATQTLKRLGYRTVMLNYNPETVSTDYDECDRLYFDEISVETVREIYRKEKPLGVVVSMGGQVPNNLAAKLHAIGINILGTSTESIDRAENRQKFSSLLDKLEIAQPAWIEAASLDEVKTFAVKVGYPVLIRPSYVLSGAAMAVASTEAEMEKFIQAAVIVNRDHPVVVSKFIQDAKEIEIDAVAKNGEIIVYAISEHIENAGVHSGDATMVLPPQRTFLETIRQVKWITREIARSLFIHGPFNIQFVAKDNEVFVIECNLRASRSFPFVSKVYRANFIDMATQVMMGVDVPAIDKSFMELDFVGIKAPQFSFTRLIGADPTAGVEMASTGEVGCIGDDFDETFLKSMLSVGYRLPIKSALVSSGPIESKAELLKSLRLWVKKGIKLYATKGTAEFLSKNDIEATAVYWPLEKETPNAIDIIRQRQVDLVINIPKNFQEVELTNDYMIRRAAVDFNIPLITNLQLARRFVEATAKKELKDLQIKTWKEYRS
jgi:carbamoyl-phosphate synthase large subunit